MNVLKIIVLCICTSMIGCTKKQTVADQASKEHILLGGLPTEPESLDPHLLSGNAAITVVQGLLEGLVIPHPSDATQVLPGVATHWECSDDHLCWIFYLRPEARWSNGEPVVASDFVYSYERALSPELGAPLADMLSVLKNAKLYQNGTLADFNQVGVRALDAHTLQLTLEHPAPYLLPDLTQCVWMPVHRATIEKQGGTTNRLNSWTLPEYYVGNGPFKLKSWTPNDSIELTANGNYWDHAHVGLRGILWRPYTDQAAEERAFRAGQLHYCTRVPVGLIEEYRKHQPELLHIDPYFATYFFRVNTTHPALSDSRVRLALSLSIDRELIVKHVMLGGETAALGLVPPGLDNYPYPDKLRLDIHRAQQLLAEAGYTEGKNLPAVEIMFNNAANHRALAEAIAQMWQTNLGIEVKLHHPDWKVCLEHQANLEYQIIRGYWVGTYPDAQVFLDIWTTGATNNLTGWANPHYDTLIRQASYSTIPAERTATLAEAESMLMDASPVIPVFWYTRIYLLDPRVQGWDPHPTDVRPLKLVHFAS